MLIFFLLTITIISSGSDKESKKAKLYSTQFYVNGVEANLQLARTAIANEQPHKAFKRADKAFRLYILWRYNGIGNPLFKALAICHPKAKRQGTRFEMQRKRVTRSGYKILEADSVAGVKKMISGIEGLVTLMKEFLPPKTICESHPMIAQHKHHKSHLKRKGGFLTR